MQPQRGDAELAHLSTYVAKPTHMSANHGLFIVKNGINIRTGMAITPQKVSEQMNAVLDTPSNSNEWLLQNMPRGFVIQEYIEGSQEIKIQTIWGQAAEISWFKGGHTYYYYYYTVEGKQIGDAPPFPYMNIWQEAIKLAEKVAIGSDALRVDIMLRVNQDNKAEQLMVNEIELRSQMYWPNNRSFTKLLNFGYRQHCPQPT